MATLVEAESNDVHTVSRTRVANGRVGLHRSAAYAAHGVYTATPVSWLPTQSVLLTREHTRATPTDILIPVLQLNGAGSSHACNNAQPLEHA